MKHKCILFFENFLFFGRWFQAPMYFGLILVGFVYAYKFFIELYSIVGKIHTINEEIFMLSVLTLIDITMVSNLLMMVILGGYMTFVSRIEITHEDKPDWLDKMDASTIKLKLALSLVSISGVDLLKNFFLTDKVAHTDTQMKIMIHITFLFTCLALAATEWISKKTKSY